MYDTLKSNISGQVAAGELQGMRMPELRELCRGRQLAVSGNYYYYYYYY